MVLDIVMKEFKIIHTDVGDLEIPRSVRNLIEVRKADDQGSNLMEGYNTDMGATAGYLGSKFNGYESQGRTPFTIKEIEDFILLCSQHPKMAERFSHLLILIIGQVE